mmetsp:Transcript_1582/g.5227  ORF Transcript_1582/g.5227 Transcript_1582/m.5227 type:complete len:126 (-) Transcript_1582:17-394(-)
MPCERAYAAAAQDGALVTTTETSPLIVPSRMSACMALKLLPPPDTKTAMAALGGAVPASGRPAADADVDAGIDVGIDADRHESGDPRGRRMHGSGGTHPRALRTLGWVDICPDGRVVAALSPRMA